MPSEITPLASLPVNNRLTYDECVKIGGALQRLNELKEKNIVKLHTLRDGAIDSRKEAEGLIEYLSETLVKHASELLGCWFVTKGELQPLIQALMPIVQRVNMHIAAQTKKDTDEKPRP